MILTTLRIGGRATFSCNEGFSLKGDDDIGKDNKMICPALEPASEFV